MRDERAIAADSQKRAMGEIDDLQHAENDQQARRDHEKHRRRGHDIEE